MVKKATFVLMGIFGLFLVFGALAALSTVGEVRAGLASRDWPTVQGEVLTAQRRKSSMNMKSLEYRYTVAGTDYTSTRAAFIRPPYIDPIHRKYHAGMQVPVYYDPSRPARSVVEPGAPLLGVLAESLAALIMFGIGGAGLYFGFRRSTPSAHTK